MKKIAFLLFLFLSAAALAQNNLNFSTFNNQAQSYSFYSHPAHADYKSMSQEQSVLQGNTYIFAQGDRPASDFAQPDSVSLGTVARELKKEHAECKKSRVVWINQ